MWFAETLADPCEKCAGMACRQTPPGHFAQFVRLFAPLPSGSREAAAFRDRCEIHQTGRREQDSQLTPSAQRGSSGRKYRMRAGRETPYCRLPAPSTCSLARTYRLSSAWARAAICRSTSASGSSPPRNHAADRPVHASIHCGRRRAPGVKPQRPQLYVYESSLAA